MLSAVASSVVLCIKLVGGRILPHTLDEMAPPQTSLSAFYSTPHIDNIEPSGKVTYTDTTTEQHWRLYARCETARSAKTVAATDADDADDADDAADADAQVNPRLAAVIQHLTEARADLDVIVDVASVLADTQQHLSIQHVPRSITGEARHQQVVAMALKKRQLRGIADRLSASANVLRDKYLREPAADAFAIDLEELERRWAVSEYPHLGTNYEDDCFAISVRFAVEDAWSDWLRSHSLGKDTFVIARDRNADGGACAVFNDELTFGWERIDAALRQRRSERAWRLVQVALEQEAVTTNTDDGAGAVHDKVTYGAMDVQRAVLALSRGATGSPSSPSSLSSSVDRICLDDCMLYVEKFARTDECRTLFKKKGLKALEDAGTCSDLRYGTGGGWSFSTDVRSLFAHPLSQSVSSLAAPLPPRSSSSHLAPRPGHGSADDADATRALSAAALRVAVIRSHVARGV